MSGYAASRMNEYCQSKDAWSIVDLASPSSQLAGVLAGFTLVAIAALLAMPSMTRTQKFVNGSATTSLISDTFALLGTGAVILALDAAYLFALLAATKPQRGDQAYLTVPQVCGKSWVLGMPALGMLAVGSTMAIAAICGIVAQYGSEHAEADTRLVSLGLHATSFVVVGSMTLLTYDSVVLLNESRGGFGTRDLPPIGIPEYLVILAGVILTSPSIVILRKKERSFKGAAGFALSSKRVLDPRSKAVGLACGFCLIPYFLLTPLFYVLWVPADSSNLTALRIIVVAIGLCMGIPAFVYALIAAAMPSPYIALDKHTGHKTP